MNNSNNLFLPKNIWIKIFEFDTTYYDIFNTVLSELVDVSSLWKIHFHHQDLRYSFSTSKFLPLYQVKNLCEYWNNKFLQHSYTSSYRTYYDKRNKFCSPVHISDFSNIINYFPRLKANILSSKIIKNWEKNKMIKYNV